MKLLKVQLDAIKSYQKQTVEFRPGTNSICGQNGAGKSTIVEAVGWALFDSLSYKQDLFIRDGARWGQVVVTFEARDGREYEVVRRAGSGAVWYITDLETQEKYTTGAADTRDWLRRNLIGAEDGVALNVLFENAVGVPQGGLCAPFLQTAQRRKESFDPILRVDEYEKAWQNLRETRSELDRRVQELELQAAGHARAAEELPAIEAEVLETNRVIAASAARHAELKREHARQSDRVAALRAAAEKIAALDQHVRTLEQIRDSMQSVRENEQRQVDAAWEAYNVIEQTSKNHRIYESADR
ncbi:MAG: AAA family ATPase, partial [Chloroflexia bacterium]